MSSFTDYSNTQEISDSLSVCVGVGWSCGKSSVSDLTVGVLEKGLACRVRLWDCPHLFILHTSRLQAFSEKINKDKPQL